MHSITGMDWTRIITDLRAAGLTQTRIAKKCGCLQSTISMLERGRSREPKGGLAIKLLRLHGIHCAGREVSA